MNIDALNQSQEALDQAYRYVTLLKLSIGFNSPQSKALDTMLGNLSLARLGLTGLFIELEENDNAPMLSAGLTMSLPPGRVVEPRVVPIDRSKRG